VRSRGLPQVSVIEAIKYIKNAYKEVGNKLKSFDGMTEAMGIKKEFGSRAFGELRDYNLIIQEGVGWRITDLGRRVASDEKNAVIEVLLKNDIMKHLFDNFKDQNVDKDFLETYIKKRRLKYNINSSTVADRFIDAMKYINGLQISGISELQEKTIGENKEIDIETVKIAKLVGSLSAPNDENEIANLIGELTELAKKHNLKTLFGTMNALKGMLGSKITPSDIIKGSGSRIIEAFEEDLGIELDREEQTEESE